jgi:DNA-binding PadR family transcriptional regulator
MPTNVILGEFEQLVLLGILRLGDRAYALQLREDLSRIAGRHIARGALYRTLDRLAAKGLVDWDVEDDAPARGGLPRRRFAVTRQGVAALRRSRRTLLALWEGLGEVLG